MVDGGAGGCSGEVEDDLFAVVETLFLVFLVFLIFLGGLEKKEMRGGEEGEPLCFVR